MSYLWGCVWAAVFVMGLSGTTLADGPIVPETEPDDTQPKQRWTMDKAVGEDAIIVTATRRSADAFDVPYLAESITSDRIRQRGYRTLPQTLRDIPGVMVQETAAGQGSPFIRGFTGFRTLLMVDGVRINNSVWRDGPNQYFATVDAFSLDRVEIVKGPASVLYGSDAIGGAVNAITRDPYGYNDTGQGVGYGGRGYFRGSTAENSLIGRGEFSVGIDDHTGFIGGITGKNFGDVYAGGDVGNQEGTGYDEYAADFKAEHFFNPDTRLVVFHNRVRQNNVPRTHRTTDGVSFNGSTIGSTIQRDTDQERELTYLRFDAENIEDSFITAIHATFSYQRQSETRHRIRPPSGGGPGPNRVDYQGLDVDTFGLNLQLESDLDFVKLTYGVEYYHDNVNSFSSSSTIQGPVADDATYETLGLFVQGEFEVVESLTLILGGRFTHVAANLDSVADPATSSEIHIDESWSDFVGSARLVFAVVPDHINVFGGVSQGFRAPNLSDLSRFSSARSGEFEIPAPGLDPEFFTQYEVGLKATNDDANFEIAFFHTDIKDQIERFPTTIDPLTVGADAGDVVITKDNVGDGFIQGIEAGAAWRFAPELTAFGNIAWQDGEVSTFGTAGGPLRDEYPSRIMPLTSQVGLRYDSNNMPIWIETVVQFAAKADKLSTRDTTDTQRIPPGGTPGYSVWHVRGGWRIHDNAELTVGIDNITNEDYRIHGSGSNMPGTNLIVGVNLTF